MKKQLDSVKQFHDTYKIGYSNDPIADLGPEKNTMKPTNTHTTPL